jgi:hypothetical protein
MKNLFTTLILMLALSPLAFSQSQGDNEVIATVGYNGSTVTTSNVNADYRSGFNVGLGAEHYFSESWGFKAKVLYDQKGWANGYYNNLVTAYQLPLMADWHFGHTKNWYLNFGPYVAFLMNAKLAANGLDVKSFFNGADGGLDLGIGVKFPVAEHMKFFIELNGQGGVADIGKNNSGSTIRNSVSSINIGLNFK